MLIMSKHGPYYNTTRSGNTALPPAPPPAPPAAPPPPPSLPRPAAREIPIPYIAPKLLDDQRRFNRQTFVRFHTPSIAFRNYTVMHR